MSDNDPSAPLSTRQEHDLSSFFLKQRRPISLIVFEDGQSPRSLLEHVLGARLGYDPKSWDEPQSGATYNLAAHSHQPSLLAERIENASDSARLIVLYAGASSVAEGFVDQIEYLLHERFDTGPEIVVLFDRLDLKCNTQGIRDLFPPADVLDLTFSDKEDSSAETEEILMKHLKQMGLA